jgi:hypothetical protein
MTLFGKMFINAMQLASGLAVHIFPRLYIRPSTQFVKKHTRGMMLTVVELGTDRGYNARSILDNLNVENIYLVDPYLSKEKIGKHTGFGFVRTGSELAFKEAQRQVKKHSEKVLFIRKLSTEAIDEIPDDIDFLYIDAVHEKEWVEKELELYYPKMKKGGVIGGHDAYADFIGVMQAAIEFANKKGLELQGKDVDWWFVVK